MKIERQVVWDAARPPLPWVPPAPHRVLWLIHTECPFLLNAVLQEGMERRWKVLVTPSHWTADQVNVVALRHSVSGRLTGTIADPQWCKLTTRAAQDGIADWDQGGIGIFTSGTSGEPKLVLYSWDRIRLPGEFAARRFPSARWLMTYEPTTYAGIQVFFTALATGGSIVYPLPGAGGAGDAVRHLEVEAISATPTWWRMLLSALPKSVVMNPLLQASLGGERVDQAILDAIRTRFAPQGLTHIYASTEVGSAIVVSDGREGFPSAWLNQEERTVRLRIQDGFLEICSPYGMVGYAGQTGTTIGSVGWYRTPDLVKVYRDRVHFHGRADTLANIGGAKVMLEEVEQSLMALGWFSDCRVYTRRNPVTGTLLCAEVVPALGRTVDIAALKQALAGRLPNYAQPQLVNIVSSLQLSSNGKKPRS